MIDLTGFVDRAIADGSHPPSPLIPIIFAELDRTAHISRDGHRRRLAPAKCYAAFTQRILSDDWLALAQLIRWASRGEEDKCMDNRAFASATELANHILDSPPRNRKP
jgi:hypothetical protein